MSDQLIDQSVDHVSDSPSGQVAFEGFANLIQDEALANRHRPRNLSEVVGQRDIVEILMAQNRSGKSQHRVKLFSGPSGCGKTTIARALAAFEFCENPNVELGDACGSCDSCLSVIDGRRAHPDVHEYDASSNSSRKEDIERLVSRFDIVPMQGAVQVFILDEAHGLSRAAQDALLTHIENLAPHNRIYLLTTEPDAMPSTIRGRAQHFRLALPASSAISDFLLKIAAREGWNLSREVAEVIVDLTPDAEGVRQAVTNLSKLAVLFEDANEVTVDMAASLLGAADTAAVAGIVDAVTQRDPALVLQRLADAREVSSARDLYRSLLRELRTRWRETVAAGFNPEVFGSLSDDVLDALRSPEYTDFLVELSLVRAAKPRAGYAAHPSELSDQPDSTVATSSEPEALELSGVESEGSLSEDPASAVETLPGSGSSEPGSVEPASTESVPDSPDLGSAELKSQLVEVLESQDPRPQVAIALVSQYASVSASADRVLVVTMPAGALVNRLSDPRHTQALSSAAKALDLVGVSVAAGS